jgi:hypothetical protein
MTAETLHTFAADLYAAFSSPAIAPKSHVERVIELAGGIWVGIQEGVDRIYVVFTDPVIGSSLMVPVEGITVSTVQAHMVSSRAAFGVVLP